MAAPDTFTRAYLDIEDGGRLDCWFNPTQYTISKSSKWEATPVVGSDLPVPQYGGGSPRELKLNLFFDDSDAADGDVRGVVDALFSLVDLDKSNPANANKNTARPPKVVFGWGSSSFESYCTSLSVSYLLFRANGIPVRVKADLSLLQAAPAVASGGQRDRRSQNPTTRGVRGVRSTVVRAGDSLHSIAFREYGDATLWRVIAAGNGIDDPLRLRRGVELSIPLLPE